MDNPNTGAPTSGSYGAEKGLADLKKALPASRPIVGQPQPQGPPPMPAGTPFPAPAPEGRPGTGAAVPPGIPSVILHPTTRPDVPMSGSAGPTQPSPQPGQPPDQARLAMLQMLSQSPDVSVETRSWAQEVLRLLIGGQGTPLTPAQPTPPQPPVAPPPGG